MGWTGLVNVVVVVVVGGGGGGEEAKEVVVDTTGTQFICKRGPWG